MHNFQELKIWQKSMNIVEEVYKLSSQFPKEEKYGLTSQIRRCSVSVASNIAEGAGRNTNGEFKNFQNKVRFEKSQISNLNTKIYFK